MNRNLDAQVLLAPSNNARVLGRESNPQTRTGQRPNNRAAETDFNEAQQAGKPTE